MNKNCCDKDGSCVAGSDVTKCEHHEPRRWEKFNTSCLFEKRTGKTDFECTNPIARLQAGCDD